MQFNEGILAAVDNGTFTPLAAPAIIVTPDRYTALKGETIPLVSTSGGMAPYVYASSNPTAATVDPSSGQVTVLTRGPVRILVTDAQGFPGSSDTIRTYDFDASLLGGDVLATDSVEVPLGIGLTTGLNILSFQFSFTYDTSVVRLSTVVTSGGLSSGYIIDVRDTAGAVTVAGAGTDPLSGSGELLKLRFLPNPTAMHGDSTGLLFTSFRFNEPGPSTPAARTIDGGLMVVYPNAVPVFVKSQADTSIPEGTIFDVTYDATDADGDSLTYSIVSGPSGATIVDTTGQFVFSSTFSDAGTYPVTIVVADGRDTDTLSFVLTVINVNRPPVIENIIQVE